MPIVYQIQSVHTLLGLFFSLLLHKKEILTAVHGFGSTSSLHVKRASYCLHMSSTLKFSWYAYSESSTTVTNEAYQTTGCLLPLNLNQNIDDGNRVWGKLNQNIDLYHSYIFIDINRVFNFPIYTLMLSYWHIYFKKYLLQAVTSVEAGSGFKSRKKPQNTNKDVYRHSLLCEEN